MERLFEELGLSKNESKVYSFLLKCGKSSAGEIISKTGIHRRNVYDILSRLISRGFVSEIISESKRIYSPTSPEHIISALQERLDTARQEIPKLMENYEKSRSSQQVCVFEGLKGMRTCWEDMAKNADYLYLLGATGLQYDFLKYYTPKWIGSLNRKKIEVKVLWNFDAKHLDYFLKEWDTKSKMLPSKFITKTQIFLYADKSEIVIWSDEPIAIQIQNKKITEGFIKYFDFMWKASRKILK